MGIQFNFLKGILVALSVTAAVLTAGAAESPLGSGTGIFQWTGTIKKVYFKEGDRYGVLMSDDTGSEQWFFSKSGPQALAVLLSQKAQGTPTRVLFTKNSDIRDQQSCIDIPYERWVCNQIQYIDAQ